MSTFKALILTANEFEDMELFFPYFRLLEEGVDVEIAAPQTGVIHGEHGYSVKITKTIAEVDPDRYDLLVIPGGFPDRSASHYSKDQRSPGNCQVLLYQEQAGSFDLPRTLAVGLSRPGQRQASYRLLARRRAGADQGCRRHLRRQRSCGRRKPGNFKMAHGLASLCEGNGKTHQQIARAGHGFEYIMGSKPDRN